MIQMLFNTKAHTDIALKYLIKTLLLNIVCQHCCKLICSLICCCPTLWLIYQKRYDNDVAWLPLSISLHFHQHCCLIHVSLQNIMTKITLFVLHIWFLKYMNRGKYWKELKFYVTSFVINTNSTLLDVLFSIKRAFDIIGFLFKNISKSSFSTLFVTYWHAQTLVGCSAC